VRLGWSITSVRHRYAFAAAVGVIAVGIHWLLFPLTHGRIPFLIFVPAIVLVAALAGRGPGLLVAAAGLINSTLQLAPVGTITVANPVDRAALVAYVLISILLALTGARMRSAAWREYADLRELHELSVAVAATFELKEQLALILRTLVRMQGADRGVVSLIDTAAGTLLTVATTGLDAGSLERVSAAGVGSGAHRTPLLSRSGELLGNIEVFFRVPRRLAQREVSLADICATKAATAIQRSMAEDLALEQERRFKTVLEASSVPFTIMEPVRDARGALIDFRWSYVNAAAARRIRHTPDELMGRRVGEVVPAAWDQPDLLATYTEALESGAPRERELRFEADGSVTWIQLIASPLDDGLAVWFTDITERKAQEESLRDANRRKDEFLATLAHELRNPLAPIRQAAVIAASPSASDVQKEWSHAVIERQVRHMSFLLDDLLDVSRITRGNLVLRKQTVELHSVINAALETARPLIDSRHHRLAVEIPGGLYLNADPLRLAQVVANLLTNAAKYTHPGGEIRVVAEEKDHWLILYVQDTGIGLQGDDLTSIFEMFTQAGHGSEHAQGGLGIGLALTKGLVEKHGGTIEARSAGPDKGSTFVIRLPVGELARRPKRRPHGERISRLRVRRRVLIADDNQDAAESLAVLLRLKGHDVAVVNDGEAALRADDEQQPDVVLLDIGMPLLDGYEVARQIRSRPEARGVLLIAITGWGQEKDRRESLRAGFDHHLTKPVDPEVVAQLIKPLSKGAA
jgi:PAS domain S-box-containing protein